MKTNKKNISNIKSITNKQKITNFKKNPRFLRIGFGLCHCILLNYRLLNVLKNGTK